MVSEATKTPSGRYPVMLHWALHRKWAWHGNRVTIALAGQRVHYLLTGQYGPLTILVRV